MYSVFQFTFGPAAVTLQCSVVYADIQLITHKQDDAAEVYPDHEQEEGSDGTVEQVVAAKIVDIEREAPGEHEEHACGKHGTRREETNALLLDRSPIVDNGDGRKGGHGEQEPPTGMEDYGSEGGEGYDIVDKAIPHHMLVPYEEDKHQHKNEVENECQRDAEEEPPEERPLLETLVGEIEREDKAIDSVGRQYNRAYETEREQRSVLMAHDIVDGFADDIIEFIRHDAVETGQEFPLDTCQGEEGHKGEDENQQRRHGGDEGVGQTFGALGEGGIEGTGKEIAEYMIDGHTFMAREGDIVEFIQQLAHPTLVQQTARHVPCL